MSIFFSQDLQPAEELVWRPQADIYRTSSGWVVKVELAGVEEGDLQILADGSNLIVRGWRPDRTIRPGWQHYSMEISYCSFERIVEMPGDIEHAGLQTECRQGMLLIHLLIQEDGPDE